MRTRVEWTMCSDGRWKVGRYEPAKPPYWIVYCRRVIWFDEFAVLGIDEIYKCLLIFEIIEENILCLISLCVHHDESSDKTVETQDFGKDKHQNHTDKKLWLLGRPSDTSVTDNTNGETSCHGGEAD
jgi:hypothetical protein